MKVSINGTAITGYDDTLHTGDAVVNFPGNPAQYPNFPTGYTVTGSSPNRQLISAATSTTSGVVGQTSSQVVAVEIADPSTPAPASLQSAAQVTATVNAAVAALVNSSPGALDTLKELADALGDDASFASTMTTALAAKASNAALTAHGTDAATHSNLPYATVGDGASAGASATSAVLKAWTSGECYELTAVTRDSDDTPTTATVKWPDGSGGTFTTVTKNATWLTVDAFTISHTLSGKTVTQAAVTRDAFGAVTVKPALTVA